MPEFTNPFPQLVPDKKMSKTELIRAIRLSMAAELDAASLYEAQADATDDPLVKKVLIDVANEEREHVGEFQELLRYLMPDEDSWLQHGVEEVKEMARELNSENSGDEDNSIPSIGSMK